MKDGLVLLAIFIAVLLALISIFAIGNLKGIADENTRLYEKCLIERESMSYKEATLFCKERVK